MIEMRTPLIAANWKMNTLKDIGEFPEENYVNEIIANSQENVEVAVFPPFTHLGIIVALTDDNFNVGGQDLSVNSSGAYTGEVSGDLLTDIGVSTVLVGHSERRSNYNESNDVILTKSEQAIKSGLTAVICIGETDEQNKLGDTINVITGQFDASVPKGASSDNVVIAYEPVWSIGTGRIPTIEQISNTHKDLRSHISRTRGEDFASGVRLIYGGSVNADNASEILALDDVDGALVGAASLTAKDFVAIIKAV